MHLRVEENRCGQPHCPYCRTEPREPAESNGGLIVFCSVGAILLVMLVLALVWQR